METELLNSAWLSENILRWGITLLLLGLYWALDRFGAPKIEEKSDSSNFGADTASRGIYFARFLLALISVPLLLIIWGVDFGSIAVFATTTLTLIGVALFASWSLLSNVTAYFILLLHPTFRPRKFRSGYRFGQLY